MEGRRAGVASPSKQPGRLRMRQGYYVLLPCASSGTFRSSGAPEDDDESRRGAGVSRAAAMAELVMASTASGCGGTFGPPPPPAALSTAATAAFSGPVRCSPLSYNMTELCRWSVIPGPTFFYAAGTSRERAGDKGELRAL